jgi:hypothetical protein
LSSELFFHNSTIWGVLIDFMHFSANLKVR